MEALGHHVPAYLRLAFALAMDPRLSRRRRAAVIGAAAYLVSPVDLIPGFVPVLGQLDDLLLAIGALRVALRGLDPEVRAAHLARVSLTDADLGEDVRTLGIASAWTVRRAARVGGRVAVRGARLGARGALATGRIGLRAGAGAGRAAGRATLAGGRVALRGGSAVVGRIGPRSPDAERAGDRSR